ncbi:NUDIX domain-containing protein [Nonomuraea thailandensis]
MPPIADESRELVRALVEEMTPHDGREAADLKWTLDWVDSGAPLFRVAKPATPPCHLVAYAALVDRGRASVMLVDHLKARAWLPPGGHVDPGEDPRRTVLREVEEELGIAGRFHPVLGSAPFFLTVTRTRGADAHTDVSLWFVLEGISRRRSRPTSPSSPRCAGSPSGRRALGAGSVRSGDVALRGEAGGGRVRAGLRRDGGGRAPMNAAPAAGPRP